MYWLSQHSECTKKSAWEYDPTNRPSPGTRRLQKSTATLSPIPTCWILDTCPVANSNICLRWSPQSFAKLSTSRTYRRKPGFQVLVCIQGLCTASNATLLRMSILLPRQLHVICCSQYRERTLRLQLTWHWIMQEGVTVSRFFHRVMCSNGYVWKGTSIPRVLWCTSRKRNLL